MSVSGGVAVGVSGGVAVDVSGGVFPQLRRCAVSDHRLQPQTTNLLTVNTVRLQRRPSCGGATSRQEMF